jgi:pimeloyl-ACP methyl ester carboxylesterase
VKKIHIPTLFIASENDEIVPPHHIDTLYKVANEPKEKWLIPNIGHTQALQVEEIQKRFIKYLSNTP